MVLEKIRSHLTPNVNDTGRRDTGGLKRTRPPYLLGLGTATSSVVWGEQPPRRLGGGGYGPATRPCEPAGDLLLGEVSGIAPLEARGAQPRPLWPAFSPACFHPGIRT